MFVQRFYMLKCWFYVGSISMGVFVNIRRKELVGKSKLQRIVIFDFDIFFQGFLFIIRCEVFFIGFCYIDVLCDYKMRIQKVNDWIEILVSVRRFLIQMLCFSDTVQVVFNCLIYVLGILGLQFFVFLVMCFVKDKMNL